MCRLILKQHKDGLYWLVNIDIKFHYIFVIIALMIELKNVTKYFGRNCAVNNVNLHIGRGDLFALLGPNGAGKSTILSMIAGLLEPSHGQININGNGFKVNRKKILHSIGVVFENPSFYDYLSGKENLTLMSKLKGHNEKKTIARLLSLVSLTERENDLVKRYSLGMKQRLALATALIADPNILILDEPTNGLDPEGIQVILNLLNDFSKRHQKTIVISSHQVYDVESICNKIAIINHGNIACTGTLNELLHEDTTSCFITTDRPEECEKFLTDKPWIKDFKFIRKKKSLKDFYIETMQNQENEKPS